MSDEGNEDVVEKIVPDAEGKIKADEKGKYPEVVPWNKYVGIKEMLGKSKTEATTLGEKVTSLEEKLKSTTTPEEAEKAKKELGEVRGKLQTAEDELKTVKEGTLTEKRAALTKRGVPDEKVKDMSVGELNAALVGLEHGKPGADMGGGGGAGDLSKMSPLALARQGYAQGGKSNK